jgi:hypothetical protein
MSAAGYRGRSMLMRRQALNKTRNVHLKAHPPREGPPRARASAVEATATSPIDKLSSARE